MFVHCAFTVRSLCAHCMDIKSYAWALALRWKCRTAGKMPRRAVVDLGSIGVEVHTLSFSCGARGAQIILRVHIRNLWPFQFTLLGCSILSLRKIHNLVQVDVVKSSKLFQSRQSIMFCHFCIPISGECRVGKFRWARSTISSTDSCLSELTRDRPLLELLWWHH